MAKASLTYPLVLLQSTISDKLSMLRGKFPSADCKVSFQFYTIPVYVYKVLYHSPYKSIAQADLYIRYGV